MEHLVVAGTVIQDTHIEKLHLFLDDDGCIIFLPLLWLIHLVTTHSVYGWHTRGTFIGGGSSSSARKLRKVEKYFEEGSVSKNTVNNYIGHVYHFLRYINDIGKTNKNISVHNTQSVTSKFINHYLNNVLCERLKSKSSLVAHQSAITAYFQFLSSLNIIEHLHIRIYQKTVQYMAEKDDRHKKINYICRKDRVALLEKCKSKRDRLIIRMGYEVGLRASENTGIVLGEHKAKNNKHSGLFALFDELHENKKKMSFEFTLNGKYTKGGKTRTIYFSRELLMDMYDYYMTERSVIEKESGIKCMTLFVRSDREGKGFPISSSHASSLFRKLKDKCKHINKAQSYHDLRHSFATELYHSELLNPSGHETRSESAALIVVGERLGHVPGSNATKMYIRLRRVMESLEGIEVG